MAIPLPGVWGIDLGQCALKAIRLEMIEGQVKATAFDFIEHPKILSQPDADPDQLVREALTQFLSRNSLRGDMVIISVPGQSGLARFVKLPPVEEKKIADIVKFEAKQQIPFPLEEVVWDFQKLGAGEVTDGFALETEIGLFAMKRDMVNRALQHFKEVGVEVHVIQMAPLALVNYIAYDLLQLDPGAAEDDGAKHDAIVALDIGTDNSNLVITDGHKIIWQRPIPLGGNHFTRALTKDMKLTFAKAEHLKRNAAKSPDLKKILASLKPVLNDFVGEVQRSLGYFTNTHRDANIQYMVGLGNAFRLPGLQKYLQEKLQLDIKKLQSFERVSGDDVLGAPQFSENIMTFGVPYGLALQGLKLTKLHTNLLPYEVRVERIVRGKKPWAVAAAACLLFMIAGMALGQSMAKSAFVNPKIAAALAASESARKKAAGYKTEFDNAKNEIEASKQAIVKIGAGVQDRLNWQLLMQYVNMALPQPDGGKLSMNAREFGNVHKQFFTGDAQKALLMHEQRRFAKAGAVVNPLEAAEDEEFIKQHLIQMNIEGISTMYSDELPLFFKQLHKDTPLLEGMTPEEQKWVADAAAGTEVKELPTKGWVVEVRGYYYHKEGGFFLKKTLLENLKNPEQNNVNPKLSEPIKKQILANVGFFVKYKNERVQNPEPGIFKVIRTSPLRSLLRGPPAGGGGNNPFGSGPGPMNPMGSSDKFGGGSDVKEAKPNRDSWRPIGEVAASALGEGGGFGAGQGFGAPPQADYKMAVGPMGAVGGQPNAPTQTKRQDRYEFVVLFVWKEPLTIQTAAEEQK